MRELLLPCSIFSLAVAIALHAVMPAHAGPNSDDDPPNELASESDDVEDDARESRARGRRGRGARSEASPSCRAIRLGTLRDYERNFAELYDEGRRHFLTPTPGLICGW